MPRDRNDLQMFVDEILTLDTLSLFVTYKIFSALQNSRTFFLLQNSLAAFAYKNASYLHIEHTRTMFPQKLNSHTIRISLSLSLRNTTENTYTSLSLSLSTLIPSRFPPDRPPMRSFRFASEGFPSSRLLTLAKHCVAALLII